MCSYIFEFLILYSLIERLRHNLDAIMSGNPLKGSAKLSSPSIFFRAFIMLNSLTKSTFSKTNFIKDILRNVFYKAHS